MKRLSLQLSALVIFLFSATASQAGGSYSFGFSVQQKKLDGEMTTSGDEVHTREQWAYNVTIENKSFRDLENLEIQYIMFMKPDNAGEKTVIGHINLKRKTGSTTLKFFKNFDKFSLTTESMELKGTQLTNGSYWGNGANSYAKDALKGLWLRIFVDGKQVAEYANPPSITGKEHWDTPKEKH